MNTEKTATSGEQAKVEMVREYERNANGTSNWHRHWTGALNYTDGVKLIADTCGAHWLVDLIASHQPKLREAEPFQVWTLKRDGRSWVAEATDGGRDGADPKVIARQVIAYSDFPDALLPLDLWVSVGTLLMPCEY